MHPYVIDRMVQERQEELLRLARAGRRVRASRRRWPGSRRRKADPARATTAAPQLTPACCPG
jgi:hypothetical protein